VSAIIDIEGVSAMNPRDSTFETTLWGAVRDVGYCTVASWFVGDEEV
jgi:hypothetical protein